MKKNIDSALPDEIGVNIRSMPEAKINALQNTKLKNIAKAVFDKENQGSSHLSYSRTHSKTP